MSSSSPLKRPREETVETEQNEKKQKTNDFLGELFQEFVTMWVPCRKSNIASYLKDRVDSWMLRYSPETIDKSYQIYLSRNDDDEKALDYVEDELCTELANTFFGVKQCECLEQNESDLNAYFNWRVIRYIREQN